MKEKIISVDLAFLVDDNDRSIRGQIPELKGMSITDFLVEAMRLNNNFARGIPCEGSPIDVILTMLKDYPTKISPVLLSIILAKGTEALLKEHSLEILTIMEQRGMEVPERSASNIVELLKQLRVSGTNNDSDYNISDPMGNLPEESFKLVDDITPPELCPYMVGQPCNKDGRTYDNCNVCKRSIPFRIK